MGDGDVNAKTPFALGMGVIRQMTSTNLLAQSRRGGRSFCFRELCHASACHLLISVLITSARDESPMSRGGSKNLTKEAANEDFCKHSINLQIRPVSAHYATLFSSQTILR